MKKLALSLFVVVFGLFCPLMIVAQTGNLYYLNSGFENSEEQAVWNSISQDGVSWVYQKGGAAGLINPPIAAQGQLNATCFKLSTTTRKAMLVSAPLELGSAVRPVLRFAHSQYNATGQDQLRLYFRVNDHSPWVKIDSFKNAVVPWSYDRFYDIRSKGAQFMSDGFQIGFEATVGKGWGVCIDSVVVEETDTVPMYVKSMDLEYQPHRDLPGGIQDIPVYLLKIKVLGNTGSSVLKSLRATPVGTGVQFLEADSFKVFATSDAVFKPFENHVSTLIGRGSMSGGDIVITGINHNLEIGYNYIWLTTSVRNNALSQTSVRFNFPAQGISISDTLLPQTTHTSTYTQHLLESVFYDGFEAGATNWLLNPDFQIAYPSGFKVGTAYDPDAPYSGGKCMGTDLITDGAYLPFISEGNAYYAVSPEVDLTYYINTGIFFNRYFSFASTTQANIEATTDGGKSWNLVWSNLIDQGNNSQWLDYLNLEIDSILNRRDSVKFRFGILSSGSTLAPGFNVDNFAIVGDHLHTEVGVTKILSPYDDCIQCGNDTVRAVFRNYAEQVAPDVIPVYYGLWGPDSTLVYDTIRGGIPKDGSVEFAFSTLAPFPEANYYPNFVVGIDLNGDQDPDNDLLVKPLFIQDYITPPSLVDFETKLGGLWAVKDSGRWSCLDMSNTIPTDPQSAHIWVLASGGDYTNSNSDFVSSSCYNLTEYNRYIIEFEYWSNTEEGVDGARLEYTVNDGANWTVVDQSSVPGSWNGYQGPVAALGSDGWSGSRFWTDTRALSPDGSINQDKVKFRLFWAADDTINFPQGFAINNFSVYPAPPDVGISTISTPTDTCQYGYFDQMELWVKNYGYNRMRAGDTIILGYNFESDPAILSTFNLVSDLAPGDSVRFTVPTTFDVDAAGTYHLNAYTLIEDDPWFYGTNNDTLSYTFQTWLNPVTGLLDTISSRQPDTLFIQPIIDPQYSYLWGDASTATSYDVSAPGTYYLTVTEGVHGCKTYDSVYIELLFNDVGIDSIIWPQSACELGSAEQVQVQLRNFGTDSLIIDDKIVLYYQVDGGPLVKDSLTLDVPLYSGARRWFTFTHATENFSTPDTYSIKTYTDYGGDTVTSNDTLSRSITVFGYYDLNLGRDTIVPALSYTINPESPQLVSYLWSDGVTTGARTIDRSGSYTLQVVDVNGCPASDDMAIWFRIRDISTVGLLSPQSSCNRSGTEPVRLRIQNTGSDTLQLSDNIQLSYRIGSTPRVTETIHVAGLKPGQTYDHSFAGNVNLTAFGNYVFNLTALAAGDLRTYNDTLDTLVYTNTNPVVNLPIDEDQTYYQTEMLFDAGTGANYGYSWQDGSTGRFFTATNRGTISVTVTDTVTGCHGSDSKFLNLDILDYMVTAVALDATSCAGAYEDVDVTILNNGNLLRQGANITLNYYVNSVLLFTEHFETTGIWQAGDSRIHTTLNTLVLEGESVANLGVDLTVSGDLRPENDLFERSISLLPSPEVDLGPAAQEVVFPHTLTVPGGYNSYQWSDGSTGTSFTATRIGTYAVTVTGSNGCRTTRTVYLTDDLALNQLAGDRIQVSMYPNPAQDVIHIEAELEDPGTYILEVISSTNGVVLSKEFNDLHYSDELEVSGLPSGLYFIRIRNAQMYHITKMVIQ